MLVGWLALCLSLLLLIKTTAAGSVSLKLALGVFPPLQGLCLESGWEGFSPRRRRTKHLQSCVSERTWRHLVLLHSLAAQPGTHALGSRIPPRSIPPPARAGGSLPLLGGCGHHPRPPPPCRGRGCPLCPPAARRGGAAGGGLCGSTLRCWGDSAAELSPPQNGGAEGGKGDGWG